MQSILLIEWPLNSTDFISIDCGISDGSSYVDETTGIGYISDANFTHAGENNNILLIYNEPTEQQLQNVRSFPEGTRHCYTLKPAGGKGSKYLMRARFLYGNYNNKHQLPTFDLHLGVDLWDTVKIEDDSSPEEREIIHVLSTDHIHVCLVNTNNGIPFILALELRILRSNIYETEPRSSLKLFRRLDFSLQNKEIKKRSSFFFFFWYIIVFLPQFNKTFDGIMIIFFSNKYKDDVYDRLWSLDSDLDGWTLFKYFLHT